MVLIQAFFCMGGLFSVLLFYVFKDWRSIFIYFCSIPIFLLFVFNYLFIKETPLFLIKNYRTE